VNRTVSFENELVPLIGPIHIKHTYCFNAAGSGTGRVREASLQSSSNSQTLQVFPMEALIVTKPPEIYRQAYVYS